MLEDKTNVSYTRSAGDLERQQLKGQIVLNVVLLLRIQCACFGKFQVSTSRYLCSQTTERKRWRGIILVKYGIKR